MSLEDWIIGTIESEGSFVVITHKNGKRYPSFNLGNTDESMIRILANFFQFGKVYTYEPQKPNWSKSYHFAVWKREDLKKLRKFCKGRLRTDFKKRDLAKWDEFLYLK
jgi:hypothetical protein